MGQLGYSSRIIQQMPKDRDGYPFQVSTKFLARAENFKFRKNGNILIAFPFGD